MKRGRNYKDLQTKYDPSTFSQYAGTKISNEVILEEFKNSIFYDNTMTYEVVFNCEKNTQLQPIFVIMESKTVENKKYKMSYFYGIQGYMWMSPSVFSLVKNRAQESLSALTQSKADELSDGKQFEGLLFKFMNYKYDLSEIEKEIERFNDKKLLEESDDDEDEEEEEKEKEEIEIKKIKKE